MTALNPWGLLALVAIPVLVALSLWRWRRRSVQVSSLLLWARVAESRRKAPASRRRRLLDPLVILRLAVAVCAAGAIADLALVRHQEATRRVVLVLDRSASMSAPRPDGRSRWAAARDALLNFLAKLNPSDRVDIIALPRLARTAGTRDLDPRDAADILSRLEPSQAALNPADLAEAAALAAGEDPSAILLATDARPAKLPAGVAVLATGGPTANRGIVALAARKTPAGGWQVLVGVGNAAQKPASCRLSLLADGKQVAQRTLTIAPRTVTRTVVEADLDDVSVLEARLQPWDALPADDVAWLARTRRPVRIAWVGPPEPYTRRALVATGRVDLVDVPGGELASAGGHLDLAIYHRAVPPASARARLVVIAPRASVGVLKVNGSVDAGALIATERDHPLLRAVSLEGIRPGRVVRTEPPGNFHTLARADGVPALGLWRQGAAEILFVGLDPPQGNWPRLVSFPIFWANVVDHFACGRSVFAAVKPGRPIRVAEGQAVKGPDGRSIATARGVFVPDRVGLYATADGRKLAVSLLDERETLAVGTESPLPENLMARLRATSRRPIVRRLGPWATLACLVFLLIHEALSPGRGRTGAPAQAGKPVPPVYV